MLLRHRHYSCLLQVKFCPLPQIYVKALTPSTSECDLIWKQGHCRCDHSHAPRNYVSVTTAYMTMVPDYNGAEEFLPPSDDVTSQCNTLLMCL